MIPKELIEKLADDQVAEPEPEGSLFCLSVHRGDMKFSFDSANPDEVKRAQRAVEDMLSKGYLLFVLDEGGKLHRATAFDPKTNEYVIKIDMRKGKEAGKKARGGTKRVAASKARARAVAPTAGG